MSTTKRLTLLGQVQACRACAHGSTRKQVVFAKGDPLSSLCFVGEAPGAEEDETGLPFVGDAGKLLDKQIAAMREYAAGIGVDFPASPYVCNVLKCRPPGNKLLSDGSDIAACSAHLWTQLRLLPNLRVIVALGKDAAQTFHSAATVLGFTAPEDMIVSFRAAESVQAQYRKVLADQRATQNKTVEAERAKLVADLVSSAVGLSPALEAEMLGIDPMDREAAVREKRSVKRKGQPWSVEQIRRYAMKVEGETSAIQTRVAAPLKSGNDQPAAQGPLAPAEPAVKPPVMTRSAVEEAVLEAAKYMNIKPQSVAVAMKQ